jgi:hypothetical protein
VLLVLPVMAGAQEDWPDLTGVWRGLPQAVQVGPTPYRPTEQAGVRFADEEIPFVFEITDQNDNRFVGTMTAHGHSETIIGALRANKQEGLMQSDNGVHDFALTDPDTMDLCYQHNIPNSRVVACYVIRRER